MFGNWKYSVLFVLMLAILFTPAICAEEQIPDTFLWERVDTGDTAVVQVGRWFEVYAEDLHQGLELSSPTSTAFIEFDFTGSGVRWIGSTDTNRGIANIYLNDELVAEGVDTYSTERIAGEIVYEVRDLDAGQHTLHIQPTGERRDESRLSNIHIDALEYIPTLEDAIAMSEETLNRSVYGPAERIGDPITAFNTQQQEDELAEAIREALQVLESEDLEPEDRLGAIAGINRVRQAFEKERIIPLLSDRSPYDNDGTVRYSPRWVTGRKTRGLLFDGIRDYVELPAADLQPESSLDDFSAEAWIYWLGTRDRLTSGILGGRPDPVHFEIRRGREEGRGTFRVRLNGIEHAVHDSIRAGEWIHLAFTYDDAEGLLTLYVNGEPIGSQKGSSGGIVLERLLYVGESLGRTGGRPFHGVIDELRLWNIALTTEAIEENMDRVLNGDEEGLFGYWTFDEVRLPQGDEG